MLYQREGSRERGFSILSLEVGLHLLRGALGARQKTTFQ